MILLLIPILFSLHQILVRKGFEKAELFTGNFLSIATTALLFLPALILRFYADVVFICLMILAGILNFVLARLCFYASIRRVGANVASALSATRIYFAELFGVLIGEEITLKLFLASTLIFSGIVLLSNPKKNRDFIGVMLGLLTAIFVVLSSIVIKIGLRLHDDPIFGSSIGYLSAFTLFVLGYLVKDGIRLEKSEAKFFILAGFFVGVGHLLRYYALSSYPVSVVEPILSIYPLFTLLFSYIFIKEMEFFDRRTILGCLLIVAGVYGCFV